MNRFGRNSLILLGIAAAIVFVGAGAALADQDSDARADSHAYLGVMLGSGPEDGARIVKVMADTAADRAGLLAGDVVIGYEGRDVDAAGDLVRRVLDSEPGERVDLVVLREGREVELTVELGESDDVAHRGFAYGLGNLDEHLERLGEHLDLEQYEGLREHLDSEEFQEKMERIQKHFDSGEFAEQMERLGEHLEGLGDFNFNFRFGDDDARDRHHRWVMRSHRPLLGVELVPVTPELREHLGSDADRGVLVGRVIEDMPAGDAGVRVGDLIVAVDGRAIEGADDLRRALRDAQGTTFDIEVIRDGRSTTLTARLPEPDGDDDDRDSEGAVGRPSPRPSAAGRT